MGLPERVQGMRQPLDKSVRLKTQQGHRHGKACDIEVPGEAEPPPYMTKSSTATLTLLQRDQLAQALQFHNIHKEPKGSAGKHVRLRWAVRPLELTHGVSHEFPTRSAEHRFAEFVT